MIADLIAPADVAAARQLIEGNGLIFQAGFDDLVGIHDQGDLVAVGARAGRVLKMLAIAPAHRGGSLLGEIVSALVSRGIAAGFDAIFVFTKPGYAGSFEALNFTLLADQGQAALLEFGNGLKHWLAANGSWRRAGVNGAVVVPGAPFSPGRRHLIETAARQVDHLYVFVVAEDHYRLVREGVGDIANVIVLDIAHYRIGATIFPTYFLKPDDPVERIRAELDATLFATRIAPFFGIARRFTCAESTPESAADEAAMTSILQTHGIEVSAIPHPDCNPNSNPLPGDKQ